MNFNLDRTKKIFLIISAVVVVIYVLIIVFFTLLGQKATKKDGTPVPTGIYQPQGSTNYQQNRPAPLTGDDFDRLIISVENRRELPPEDAKIRKKLADMAQGEKAIIYSSPAFNIKYAPDRDLFHVDIQTDDIDYARTEAFRWFSQQGLNTAWLCDLPTIFFKNPTSQKGSRLEFYECAPNSNHD